MYISSGNTFNCLDLLTLNVMVDKHGLVLVDLNCGVQIVAELLLVAYELHCAAAKHEGGTHENGVADLLGNLNAVLDLGYRLALGLGNVEGNKQLLKCVAVFRSVNSLTVGADDLYTAICKGLCKVDSRLTAERCDNALGLLIVDNVHNVLNGEGLKVELVRGGVVG